MSKTQDVLLAKLMQIVPLLGLSRPSELKTIYGIVRDQGNDYAVPAGERIIWKDIATLVNKIKRRA